MPIARRRHPMTLMIVHSKEEQIKYSIVASQNPYYKSSRSVADVWGYQRSVKYSSDKVIGDRRNATPYAAVTVYTGSVSSGWSTYRGPGWQPHTKYKGVVRFSPLFSTGVFGISPSSYSRNLTVPSKDVTWARSLAASNALSAEFSLLTTLAEMKSTVEGIADIAAKLARSAASLKKGRFKAALRHLGYSPHDISVLRNKARTDLSDRGKSAADVVGNAHLTYRYGIMPIIYDLDALKKLWEEGVGSTHYFVVKGLTKRKNTRREAKGTADEYEVDDNYQVRFKACYKVDSRRLAMLSLLGATDLLGTIWELVPYSFVVDWALNIGDFLRGLQAPIGMSYFGGHVSVKGTTTITYTKPAKNAYTQWHRPAQRCEGYIRQVLGTPTVSLMFQNPFENSTNITTALALINQKMR